MKIIRWEYCTPVNTIILLPFYAWQIPHSAFRERKRWAMNEEYEIIPYSIIWVCVNTCRKNQDVCKHLSFYYSIANTLTEYQPVCIIRDNKSWKINPLCFSVIILPLDIALHIIAFVTALRNLYAIKVQEYLLCQ